MNKLLVFGLMVGIIIAAAVSFVISLITLKLTDSTPELSDIRRIQEDTALTLIVSETLVVLVWLLR